MHNNILFSEKQRFDQWWLWAILSAVNGILIFVILRQVLGEQLTDNSMNTLVLLLTAIMTAALTALFLAIRLETEIRTDGIYVRFFPFHLSFRKYPWNIIEKAFVRTYNPISEYGGWGLRGGLFKQGKAFNVSGNKGLQLVFDDDRRLLIGTNKPEELAQTLRLIGQLKE